MRAWTVMVAVTVLSAAGCGSGAHPRAGSAISAAATTTAAPPRATLPVAPTTTLPPLIPQLSPDVAATALLTAWQHGDRGAAAHAATAAAIDALFGHPVEPVQDRGCQDPIAGASACAFMYGDGGLLQMHAVSLAGGWVVEAVDVTS